MLSIAPVTSSAKAGHYFSQDNYYTSPNEAAKQASQWWGKGAEQFALRGQVDIKTFTQLLAGELPNGSTLGTIKEGKRQHRPGYDLTFSAPKSVSLLALLGEDKRLIEAHQIAVNQTLGQIEAEIATARATQGGKTQYEKTGNLIGALFHHDTSRAFDPQLHTHAVIMNATVRTDGQVRALASQSPLQVKRDGLQGFSEQLYHRKLHFGRLYRAELAKEVSRLGYDIVQTHQDGRFEIAGIDPDILKAFSLRRQDIEAAMAARGLSTAKEAATATLMTREAKQTISRDTLHTHWQNKAKEHQFQVTPMIERAKGQAQQRTIMHPSAIRRLADKSVSYAATVLAEREAVYTHDALFKAAQNYAFGDLRHADISAAIDRAIETHHLIPVAPLDNQARVTTQAALALEKDNIDRMKAGQGQVSPLLNKNLVASQLMGQSLTSGQQSAVSLILQTSDRVTGVQGFAGTGKTTMLQAAQSLIASSHIEIKGMAPTAAAAKQLSESLGVPCQTVDQFLLAEQNALALGTTQQTQSLWLLDEASMLSSRAFNDVLILNQQLNTHLVVIGDKQQLASVEAGKPFAQLQKAGMKTAIMKDILRQQKGSELYNSVHDTIRGDISRALQRLDNQITECKTKEERLATLAEHYLALSPKERAETLVITPANVDRKKVNEYVRTGLQAEGIIKQDAASAYILKSCGLTLIEKQHAKNYAAEQVLRFNRNSKTLNIKAGQYYRIQSIDMKSNTLVMTDKKGHSVHWQPHRFAANTRGGVEVFEVEKRQLAEGERLRWTRNIRLDKEKSLSKTCNRLNAETAIVTKIRGNTVTIQLENGQKDRLDLAQHQNQHWDYAYASTVYHAQGQTIKRVLAHDESFRKQLTNQRAFYVILSRAQESAHLYVDNKEQYLTQLQQVVGDKTSSLESLFSLQQQESMAVDNTQSQRPEIKKDSTIKMPELAKLAEQRSSPAFYDVNVVLDKLNAQAEHVVEKLLGEPNKQRSNQQRWQYGRKGSLSVTMQGEKRGCWYSFETQEGGNLLHLIQRENALSFKDSLVTAAEMVGVTPQEHREITSIKTPVKPLEKSLDPTQEDRQAIAKAQRLWQKSQPIEGTLAQRYCREHRGIALDKLPKSFRFLPNYYHFAEKRHFPAMLVGAQNKQGQIEAVQAICLDKKTGNKADVSLSKITHGRVKFGAHVVLNQTQSSMIFAAEGPETALSILNANAKNSVVATLSSSNFKLLTPSHPSQQQLVLCGDNDHGAKESVDKLSSTVKHLNNQFRQVTVAMPEKIKTDFNDVQLQQGLAAVAQELQKAAGYSMENTQRLTVETSTKTSLMDSLSKEKTSPDADRLMAIFNQKVSEITTEYDPSSVDLYSSTDRSQEKINDLSSIER